MPKTEALLYAVFVIVVVLAFPWVFVAFLEYGDFVIRRIINA